MENLENLVKELIKHPTETPWLEFKHNNYDPDTIGKDISALANSATYHERRCAYMLWGVDDSSHEIVGTEKDLQTLKINGQELENWLRSLLSANADFEFHSIEIDNKKVVILIIYKATVQTVMFKKVDYIRVGSYTKKLSEVSSMQGPLWDRIRGYKFEEQIAMQDLTLVDVFKYIDYSIYFDIIGIPQPSESDGIAHFLIEEGIIIKQDNGLYSITNMGAILFAKNLSSFSRLFRKSVRIIQYGGNNKLDMLKEETIEKGYAIGFEGVMKYIEAVLPSKEIIEGAIRRKETPYPGIAVREAVANALIHQDFSVTGTGPVVEIFNNRIEITNSGAPLVDINRIIDNPAKSRNEKLASLMRKLRMCEELGTGWDKIVIYCELMQLPAPKIDLYGDSTKVTLFSEKNFSDISPEDKIRACYMHACIKYIQGEQLTNSSFRERFGLKTSSSGSVSRIIKDSVEKGLIKPLDPETAPRYMKYIPIWA